MYTQQELEKALELQQRLASGGLDSDYAAIRVRRVLDRISEPAEKLAAEIIADTPAKFMTAPKDSADGTFRDELQRRIADEKAAQRGGKRKDASFYDEIRARVRAELDANKPRDLAGELDKITGRR